MKASLVERTADALLALGRGLLPHLKLLQSEEDIALFAQDLDRLTAMIADGAGVVVVLTQLAGMARRLREAAASAFDVDAEETLARIEGSALRIRDAWLHHVVLRRERRSREEDGTA
jgi:hypothetical protein